MRILHEAFWLSRVDYFILSSHEKQESENNKVTTSQIRARYTPQNVKAKHNTYILHCYNVNYLTLINVLL